MPANPRTVNDEHDAGPDGGGVHEPCSRVVFGLPRRCGLRKREADERGREAARRREQPHGVEAVVAEHELSEDRPEREAAPEAETEEAQRLAASVLGREVGDHGRRTDEEQRLSGSGEESQRHEERERVGDDVSGDRQRGDRAAGDDEELAATPVPEPSRERLADEDHRADRCDRQRDSEAAHAEVVVGIDGHDREQHADGRAQGELRQHREHEGLREEALGLHRAIQADRIEIAFRQERRPPTRTSARCPRATRRFERKAVGKPPRQPPCVLVVLIALRARQQVPGRGSSSDCRGGSGSSSEFPRCS